MRLVIRRRSFNRLSCAVYVSHHGVYKLHPIAVSTPQFTRLFTTRSSLAAWAWNDKSAPRFKASEEASDSVSQPSSLDTGESSDSDTVTSRNSVGWKWNTTTAPTLKPSKPVSIPAEELSDNGKDSQSNATDHRSLSRDTRAQRAATVREEFYKILETAQPDQVMAALLNYDCEELVATMPQSSFIEALHLLSPAYFVEPFKEIHRPLHPYTEQLKRLKSLQTTFDDFVRNLAAIIRIRRSGDQVLGLAEYTHLLDCARSMGDAPMADHIWEAMKRDEIEPDIPCYNHYMEAKVWDSAYTGIEKYRLRITPHAYKQRKFGHFGWTGYGTAKRSVRTEVVAIFDEMLELGHEGDETSIVNLLMANGRVGDNEGMNRILHTVWNIDVHALQRGDHIPIIKYEQSSPFYPSARLLRAVAHSYSAANDIECAIRIIEHVASAYDVEVPDSIWAELFEWAFVLSRTKYGPNIGAKSKGLVSTNLMRNIFDTMTKEPYNVEPTAEMHAKLAKTEWRFRNLKPFLYHMREAYKILSDTRSKRIAAREMIESYLRYPRSGNGEIDPEILRSRGFADAIHTYDILRALVLQQTRTIERLAKLFTNQARWFGANHDVWERKVLPRLIEEWRDFIPGRTLYVTTFGVVEFRGATYATSPRYPQHPRIPVRRPSFGEDFKLLERDKEYEDDYIWAAYKARMAACDLRSPLIRRLLEPAVLDYNPEWDNEEQEKSVDEMPPIVGEVYQDVAGRFNQQSADHGPRGFWVDEAAESAELKRSALRKAFVPL
ncbi:uncharacterized protein DSM5745_10135 [Aspergillus mulundensis]|uniref:Mitochondrial ATPase expression-domain-containing protein n=1 Tax=Aspergillus mulundensis TaxID=1810919 RepID=A0A3D8QNI8_9EURO|nr:Uncharacterized protein DSM5745_10135 [Aspergillus mulundensis]RDW63024.1 Uncharacterized protein DSM5745_10135 [Aspergillus mulundensis]